LRAVPVELGKLSDLLRKYLVHNGDNSILPCITKLDLSDNPLTSLPCGLPDSLPDLEELDIRGTSIKLLPPDIVYFSSLISVHGQKYQGVNTKHLLAEASRLGKQARTVDSLVDLALHRLAPEEYANLPPHLAIVAEQSYLCVSCSTRCFPSGSKYLASGLVEPIHLFEPPVMGVRPITMPKLCKLWIGGGTWRFCAECIVEHLGGENCMCLVCREKQTQLDAGNGIKWARQTVVNRRSR
jgi:hypothetical protein